MILKCSCAHDYQDKLYGKGRRVFNPNGKGASCTVCSRQENNDRLASEKAKKGGGGRGGAKSFIAVPPREGWPGGLPERNGYKKL